MGRAAGSMSPASKSTVSPSSGSTLMKRRLLSAAVFAALIAVPAVADEESGRSHPDLSGYWNLPYVPNMAQGKEDTVPYTPAGKAAFVNHDSKDDPTGFCLYPGVPRIMQSPYPVQFVQTGNQLLML